MKKKIVLTEQQKKELIERVAIKLKEKSIEEKKHFDYVNYFINMIFKTDAELVRIEKLTNQLV